MLCLPFVFLAGRWRGKFFACGILVAQAVISTELILRRLISSLIPYSIYHCCVLCSTHPAQSSVTDGSVIYVAANQQDHFVRLAELNLSLKALPIIGILAQYRHFIFLFCNKCYWIKPPIATGLSHLLLHNAPLYSRYSQKSILIFDHCAISALTWKGDGNNINRRCSWNIRKCHVRISAWILGSNILSLLPTFLSSVS